jgi:uptake hydrogenase small subunit
MNRTRPLNMLWLQSGGCGGCNLSLLGAEAPTLFTLFEGAGVKILWHPAFSLESNGDARAIVDDVLSGKTRLDIFCLEGSVLRGPDGTGGFHRQSGSGVPMMEIIDQLASIADHVLGIGSCAAFGGITAGGGNPAEACGLQFDDEGTGGLLGENFRSKSGLPVINIAGCPIHPDWVSGTLMQIARGEFDETFMDTLGRPKSYVNHLVHHGCPRNEFYEYKASAKQHCQLGCLMEHMGCMGTQAQADCNTRLWNGNGSCVRGGYACINCTAPGFQEPGHTFVETPKIAGIPRGLPMDMPKAWFVALASLAKAATPKRLEKNAVADHIQVPPVKQSGKKS